MKSFLISLTSQLVFLAILLVSAGTLSYWPAWLYVSLGLVMSVLTRLVLRKHPGLEEERARPGGGTKPWDKRLLGWIFLLTLAQLVVAGLDAGRFHWGPRLSWPAPVVGLGLSVAGMGLFPLGAEREHYRLLPGLW